MNANTRYGCIGCLSAIATVVIYAFLIWLVVGLIQDRDNIIKRIEVLEAQTAKEQQK